MNQQTQDQGRQELREIIGGIFDHVHRKKIENAILNARRMQADGPIANERQRVSQTDDDNERRYSKRERAGDPWKG